MLCKQTEIVFCATISTILPFVGRNGTFFFFICVVFVQFYDACPPARWKSGRDNVSRLDEGEEGRLKGFPLMCASLDGDEAYIFREAVVRVEGHTSW